MYKASTCRVVFLRRAHWRGLTAFLLAIFLMVEFFGATRVHAAPSAGSWPPIDLKPIASGFIRPIDVVDANDGTDRLFVLEKGGLIYIIENGVRLEEPFLNISDRVSTCHECGLLGLAFPPTYAQDGYFFVNYTSKADLVAPDTGDSDPNIANFGDTVIARFQVTNDPNLADADNEDPILIINQPANNHNGGHILFGPDDYLYIGTGDGGGGGDPYLNGQDPASLHGKILRISVTGTNTYTIPTSNPFTNTVGYRDEIWAMGLRNPWRFDFDRLTGDLYVADVGQITHEEVNYVAAEEIGNGGMNFGWKIMEGNVCYPPNGSQSCNRSGLTDPVVTYPHELGNCSITGGYVYAPALPGQPPVYLYGDFCTGTIWGLQKDGATWESTILDDLPFQITTFGEDAHGNVYVIDYSGTLYQIGDPIQGLSATNDGPNAIGNPIGFTATVTEGTPITYTWDFGDPYDNTVGDGITATHSYTVSGLYTVTVTATNTSSVVSATTTVFVADARVEVLGNNTYLPADVTVVQGAKVVWVLRGGNHSVTADDNTFEQVAGTDWPPFVQTFNTTGLFPYHCTVHGQAMAGSVTVQPPPPPITGLTASNDSPKVENDDVAFTAVVTGGTGISYAWDFGDGNSNGGNATTHAYTQAGLYTATVTASNLTNSMKATTVVNVGDLIINVKNNVFEPSEATIQPGERVIWVLKEGNHSVTADDGSFAQPSGTEWPPFAHGFEVLTASTSFSSASVAFSYYCTVHGAPGGNGMAGSVIVESMPSAPDPIGGLTAENDGPKVRATPIGFTAAITGGTEISYTWDFGDLNGGNVGTGITTTHTYTQSGIYTATVLATNATNSMSATTTVYVGDAVVAVTNNIFIARDITVLEGDKVVWVLQEGFHSVTADDESFEQPSGGDWPPFMQTFNESGVNPYYCSVHGAPGGNGMAGSVTVGTREPPVEDREMLLPNIRNEEE